MGYTVVEPDVPIVGPQGRMNDNYVTDLRNSLWAAIDDLARFPKSTPAIVMGDFNVVGRSHVPRYPAFRSWEYDALARIADSDLVDAFCELHPELWVGGY